LSFVERIGLKRFSAATEDEILTGTAHPRVGHDRMLRSPFAPGEGTDPESLLPDDCYLYSPWWRAVVIVGFLVARTPLQVKKVTRGKSGESKEPDRDHPAYFALAGQANLRYTAGEMKFRLVQLMLTHGTGRAVIQRRPKDKGGILIHPTQPGELEFRISDGEPWYFRVANVEEEKPGVRYDAAFPARDVIDLTLLRARNGLSVLPPWQHARFSVAEGIGGTKVRSVRAKNGGRPAIALMTEKTVTKETRERIQADFRDRHAGYEQSGNPIILGDNLKAETLDYSPEYQAEAELSRIPIRDVSNYTGVPSSLLGDTDNDSGESLEAKIRAFYQFGIGNYLWAFADQAQAKCLSDEERRGETHVCEFNVSKLEWATVRDLAEMIRAYGAGTPIATPNGILNRLGEPPIDDPEADKLHIPKNVGKDGQNNTPSPGDTKPAGRPRKKAAAEALETLVKRAVQTCERRASSGRAYMQFVSWLTRDAEFVRVVREQVASAGIMRDGAAEAAVAVLAEKLLAVAECHEAELHNRVNERYPVLLITLPEDMAAAAAGDE
jgi:HK97 family phage portal protein